MYIEAAGPGISPEEVEVTFDKGILWIKGESKKEVAKRKCYQNMTSSFSYRIGVPGDIDMKAEPEASCEDGIMTVTFAKLPQAQPKKISVKTVTKVEKK